MDFRFNINNLLPKRINKITHTLIPEGFRGDRREYNECQRLLTRILDDMGEASAKAQGLNRTITSALKLRDTDHIIYLMVDNEGNNGLGSVVGLLKTGSKTLFMFDENGLHYQLKPRCILDFYIHESRQRMGLGNELYQFMLAEENLKPIKLAIDRPSEKFLAFLMKHYGLSSVIPQNNKFVVFKGFFDDEIEESQPSNRYNSSPSPSRMAIDYKNHANNNMDAHSPKNSINGTPITRSAYGRYAATRPPCSMANIIHNTMGDQPAEHTRARRSAAQIEQRERPGTLNLYSDEDAKLHADNDILSNHEDAADDKQILEIEQISLEDSLDDKITVQIVDVAVSSNDELQEPDADDKCLQDETDNDNLRNNSTTPTCSQEVAAGYSTSGGAGHLDLKFYHSPLW